jgi:hypothetical protein
MTAQCSETLNYEGKDIALYSNPLGPYLRATNTRFVSPSTANWRGYLGKWKIIESEGIKRLYLVKLSAHQSYTEILSLSDVFPGFNQVFAHWFTGLLRCPQGKQLEYVHMGYGSTYEYDLFMSIKQGVLVHQYAQHNRASQKKPEGTFANFLRSNHAQ